MTLAQRIVVVVGLVSMIVLVLWPVWYGKVYTENGPVLPNCQLYDQIGRRVIWAPPKPVTKRPVAGSKMLLLAPRIDTDRLVVECAGVGLFAAALVVVLGGCRRRRDE